MIETARLAAVRRYDVLDTPPDGAFDRVAGIAAQVLCVPIAIISIVDHDRIWFKSHYGFDVQQVAREPGLCASCILQNKPWIVSDAKSDPRALANPLVAGEAGLQFYLGIPLRTHDGFNLGTLCVIDYAPRVPSDQYPKYPVSRLWELIFGVEGELYFASYGHGSFTRDPHHGDEGSDIEEFKPILVIPKTDDQVRNDIRDLYPLLR